MTSYYQSPYYLESCSQYPYVGKVSVGEEATVDFVYQFVKKVIVTHNTFYAGDIIGIPTKFYQNSLMRHSDITKFPYVDQTLINRGTKYKTRTTDNYIDIEFHEAVYPIRVSIYEIFMPGGIIKIWAQNSDNNEWVLLWSGLHKFPSWPYETRLFSPILQSCNFKTKRLRLEKCRHILNEPPGGFRTVLDAVMLIGLSELVYPKNRKENLNTLLCKINFKQHFAYNQNLTIDYNIAHMDITKLQRNFSKYFTIHKSGFTCSTVGQTFDQNNLEYKQPVYSSKVYHLRSYSSKNNWYQMKRYRKYESCATESKELSHCNLSGLSDEIILKIFKNLDLMSLCRMNQVNKRFNNLTRDPLLYTCLTMRYVVYKSTSSDIFCYFTPRCKYLQELDLTSSEFFAKDFVKFLNSCGSHLTCLRLSECPCINKILFKISKICKNLKELDLSKCKILEEKFLHLEKLSGLEYLNLSSIRLLPLVQSLCKILQKNQRMRELHLKDVMLDLDPIAIELKNSCPDLQVLNLQYAIQLSSSGCVTMFNALADCKNLRKVNLQIKYSSLDSLGLTTYLVAPEDNLDRFLSSCQYLEELHLSEFILTDRNFEQLTQCKNLKNLYVFNTRVVGKHDKCTIIFEQCPKLQQF